MKATQRMEKIVTEKYGVTGDSPCTPENLYFRQIAMAEVINELEARIETLERRLYIEGK